MFVFSLVYSYDIIYVNINNSENRWDRDGSMTDLQKYFIEFHDNIKLTDENEELREKRDIILKKLSLNLRIYD